MSINLKEIKSYLNLANLKEKLKVEFDDLKEIYMKAYELAKSLSNTYLQVNLVIVF